MPDNKLPDNKFTLIPESLAADIAHHGYVILDNFLSAPCIAQLAAEAVQLQATGMMRKAKTGQRELSITHSELRGDSIFWLDPNHASAAQQEYLAATHAIQTSLNQTLFLSLFELESHFAIYPIGSRYHKHIDQFQTDQSRKISCVLYLNQDWRPDDGGQLRIYLENSEHAAFFDVFPNAGRLVLFLSDRFPHEVLPATRERISITGWFRTRSHALPL
jgi:SM-20-related protein